MNNYNLTKIRQHFVNNLLTDVKGEVSKELLKLGPMIKPGCNIALAVGSRGIKNLALIIKEVAGFVKKRGAYPFIVPAMGSHGGATAEGQAAILEGYGISEETIGAPVRSSMDVVELTPEDSPCPVYLDKNSYESDGVILINRIKPHTDYHSDYESGLVKMTVIGLGKEKQASAIHRYGVYGLSNLVPQIAKRILNTGKIIGGLAIVENAYDETMIVSALMADEFLKKETRLLEIARKNMPSFPVDYIDLLIIDRMGKDISGVGLDPNIIGRLKITGEKEPDKPFIRAIVISDLTGESHGNAIGVGLSDVITRRLYDKIDFSSTYKNAITSSFLERVKIPLVADNEREAFEIALRSCGYIKEGEEKIVRIKDTLHLDELYVSKSVLNILSSSESMEVLKENCPLFDTRSGFTQF